MRTFAHTILTAMLFGIGPSYAALGNDSAVNLDEVAKQVIARERVVGASVLVARGGRIILH